jgi:hypothetical protein
VKCGEAVLVFVLLRLPLLLVHYVLVLQWVAPLVLLVLLVPVLL